MSVYHRWVRFKRIGNTYPLLLCVGPLCLMLFVAWAVTA